MSALILLAIVAAVRAVPIVEEVVPVISNTEVPIVAESKEAEVILSEPIDKATKLIIDLDEHLRKYLPSEEEVVTTVAPASYAGNDVEEVEPLSVAERQDQMTALIDQVNRLAESIENTITDLVSRRRYVTAAMLRSMLNYVRRVRVNLERLQNRLQSVAAVATTGANAPPQQQQGSGSQGQPSVPGSAFFITIRDRVNRITEEIGALVSRIRGSFTPGAGPTGSPLPPLVSSQPGHATAAQGAASAVVANAAAIVASGGINAAESVNAQ
jgi:ribosomal protein S15P/S13E